MIKERIDLYRWVTPKKEQVLEGVEEMTLTKLWMDKIWKILVLRQKELGTENGEALYVIYLD